MRMTPLQPEARDRLYTRRAQATTEAGRARESLFLARLVLLLFVQVADEAACQLSIDAALRSLPNPSLSAGTDDNF